MIFSVQACTARSGSHSPRVAVEYLKWGWFNRGTASLILYTLTLSIHLFLKIYSTLNVNLKAGIQFSCWRMKCMFGTTWVCESTF